MPIQIDIEKLLSDLRGPARVQVLKKEFNRVKTEIEKLANDGRSKAQSQLKLLENRAQLVLTKLQEAQSELDKELKSTITLLKRQAKDIEKNLARYRSLAHSQQMKLRAAILGKGAKTTKKRAAQSSKKAK
jgi:hypothetical protein